MKIWDLRSSENYPSTTFMLSGEHVMATCLVNHPTQQHLLIAGDEEGIYLFLKFYIHIMAFFI